MARAWILSTWVTYGTLETIPNFRASKYVDRRLQATLSSPTDGYWGSKIVERSVGECIFFSMCSYMAEAGEEGKFPVKQLSLFFGMEERAESAAAALAVPACQTVLTYPA